MEDASSSVVGSRLRSDFPRVGHSTRAHSLRLAFACLTAVACATAVVPRASASPNLDPFRRGAGASLATWQKTPAAPAPKAIAQAEDAASPAAPTTQPAAPAPASKPAAPVTSSEGQACDKDDQCATGTICENRVCTRVEPPIHALLFRKDGGSTAFDPFYYSNRGNPGYRVVAPFYWHFWSPDAHSRVVFPFYWRFEDFLKQRTVLVIPPYSHTQEPGAESWAVWPIVYKSTKFGWAAPLLFSFKIANPDEGRSYGLYALLYFWKRNERAGTAFDFLFPFFASSRSADSAFTWALPLTFYWRDGQGDKRDTHLLSLPFFYWSRSQNTGTLVAPVGYHSRAGENTRGSFAWLYWFGRKTDGSAYDVVFPAVWSFRGATSNSTFVPPLLWHFRRGATRFTTLFPIYWSGGNVETGSGWRMLLPIFFSRTGEEGRSFSWISLLGGYRRDDDAGTRTFGLWLPPMLFRRDGQSEFDMVLGLYWRYRNYDTGAAALLLGPVYLGADPEGSTTSVFPLFWHFRDAASGATAHTLFPLYFRRSAPDESLTAAGVFPLWAYYRNYREGGYGAGLFPIAFFGSRPNHGHGILFPLFWHFRDRQSTTTVAAPLFYHHADRQGATFGIPPLLYFYGRQDRLTADGRATSDTTHVQFPFFWRFSNGVTGNTTTVVPPFYLKSGPSGWSTGVFPLFFAGSWTTKSHAVLFPIFWHFRDDTADKSTTVVANYLHRRHGDEVTDAFFPLLHFRRGARPGGKPETSFTLFPVVHYRSSEESKTFLSPIGLASSNPDRKVGFLGPYFWYQSRTISASGVPLLYLDLTRTASQERTRMFGPFVAVDSPTSKARVLFPLFARYNDTNESGTWVFPTYFHRRTNDGYNLDTLPPLFWYSRSPKHSTTVVGPFYSSATAERNNTGLPPLFIWARNTERRFLLTPLFYDSENYKDGTGRLIAALLFYRTTRPDGHTTVGFPLYWAGRTGDRGFNVLFPVFWHFHDDKAKSSTTIVGPFFSRTASEGHYTRGLFPVAWYSRDADKSIASHALLPLFYEKHGPTELSILTVPFGFGTRPDRTFWYVPPVYRYAGASSTFTMVFPLYFGHVNRGTGTSTRLIPPLLYFSRSRPDRSLTGVLGLFWRHTDITSETTLALPFFYDIHNYHQNRLTIIAPLFLRYWGATEQTSYSLAPLFYRRSGPSDSTTVLFPLFWDFNGGARRTTMLLPLFASFRRPTYVSRFIFPNIYYRSGLGAEEGTSRLVIFPLWESGAKRPGDTMWEVLLGLFGYERIGRNRYLRVFFFPFELEPAPAAQTAWYGRPRQRVQKTRHYGLDTHAW